MEMREIPDYNDLSLVEEEARSLNEQAWNTRRVDVHQARLLAEQSLELCKKWIHSTPESPSCKLEYANALLTLSFCDVRLSNYTEAIDKAHVALRYFEETESRYGKLYCMENMVRAYGTRGDFPTALDFATQCLQIADELGDTGAMGRAMNMLGVLYWHTGEYNSALGWYMQSLTLLKEANNQLEMSEVLNNLGLIYTSLGDYDKAFEYCISALMIKQDIGDKLGESHSLLNLGNLYMYQGSADKALEHYLECLYIQEEITDRAGHIHTLLNLAEVYLELGETDRSVECIGSCLDLTRSIGDRRLESYALGVVASLHERFEEYDQALTSYSECLHIRHDIGYRQGEIVTLISMGALCTKLERFDNASVYLLEALRIAESLNTRNRLYEVHEKLSILYEQSGDPARALYHHKQFYSLQKDTMHEQDQLRIRNLQALYELEQATKEARIYRLENVELVSANAEILRQKEDLEKQTEVIREANTQLLQKNNLLEYMNREKDEFLGVTVHGLKNPITNIALAVAMLKNRQSSMSSRDIENNLDWIESTIWRMDDIVQKLLQSNALEAGKIHLQPVPLALPSLVLQVVKNYNAKAAAKNITLEIEKSSEDMMAYADPAMTEDIIDNLVSNAIKFSPAHTTVHVRIYRSANERQTQLSIADDTNIYVAVQDEGPGITTEDSKRLFGRFERLSAKPTGGEQSSGLGLSIVKQLIEKMNGKVWCESHQGEGATFIVELPTPPSSLNKATPVQ